MTNDMMYPIYIEVSTNICVKCSGLKSKS